MKTILIELNECDYRRFIETTEKLGIKIKEASREAVNEWVKDRKLILIDPIFKINPKKTGTLTKSSELDEQLYRK